MAEQQPAMAGTVRLAAEYLGSLVPRCRVLFIDGGSCPQNVEAAGEGGAVVLRQDDLFGAIDWERMLPLLNLRRRPSGRAGQGLNVFAGHLALIALGVRDDDIIFQCDADVRGYSQLAPLERLLVVCAAEPDVQHVKFAQPGRNNEMVMVARAMQQLWTALDLPWVPAAVKELSRRMFLALGPDKWLTCGLYVSTGTVARARPFASGYLDAATQAFWSVCAPECRPDRVRYVECPVLCEDAKNTATKEALMHTSVAMYLQSVVMNGKAPHLWSFADFKELNRSIMPRLRDVPVIGDADGPVAVHRIEQDRLIPPIHALSKAGIVDLTVAADIAAARGLKTGEKPSGRVASAGVAHGPPALGVNNTRSSRIARAGQPGSSLGPGA